MVIFFKILTLVKYFFIIQTMAKRSSAARHTFYYLLILFTLSFTAIGVGQIIFQIINKVFPETFFDYDTSYSQEILRFGLSSVIIASPIYYWVARTVNKELATKLLDQHSLVRKWLTYLIIFVASVTVIGFLMGILNSFFNGELTIKFILKALSAILIAGLIFLYYFYDIRREKFAYNRTILAFRTTFIVIVLASIVAGFIYIDSPFKVREYREDNERINRLRNLSNEIDSFYWENDVFPQSLEIIEGDVLAKHLKDPVTGERFQYQVLEPKVYQLCATFNHSNREEEDQEFRYYYDSEWLHDAGEYCFEQKVIHDDDDDERIVPRRMIDRN